MGMKLCEKCGESADETKAFCPACGDPFVIEEKRESSSEFDKYAGTVNVTQSVYKMMLKEFEEESQESAVQEKVSTTAPISVETTTPANSVSDPTGASSNSSLLLTIGIGVVLILGLGLLLALLIYFY